MAFRQPHLYRRRKARIAGHAEDRQELVEEMKMFFAAFATAVLAAGAAYAASATNLDAEPRTIVVTEGGTRVEVVIAPGETEQICQNGCFVTMPDGDRAALSGSEAIEIEDGKGRLR